MARNIRHFVNNAREEAAKSAIWLESFRKGRDRVMMVSFLDSNRRVSEHDAEEAEDIAGDVATIGARAWASATHTYAAIADANWRRAASAGDVECLIAALNRLNRCLETIELSRVDLKAPAAEAELKQAEGLAATMCLVLEGEIRTLRAKRA